MIKGLPIDGIAGHTVGVACTSPNGKSKPTSLERIEEYAELSLSQMDWNSGNRWMVSCTQFRLILAFVTPEHN